MIRQGQARSSQEELDEINRAVTMEEEGKKDQQKHWKGVSLPSAWRDKMLSQSAVQTLVSLLVAFWIQAPLPTSLMEQFQQPVSHTPDTWASLFILLPVALILFVQGLWEETLTPVIHVLNLQLFSLCFTPCKYHERISSVPYINPQTIGLSISNLNDYFIPQFTI